MALNIMLSIVLAAITQTLPVMHIVTDQAKPITSRTEYIDGAYWLESYGSDSMSESLGSEAEPLPLQIRGRGHSSWRLSPKKPYKIKLGERTSLLGMADNKHWALLKPGESAIAGLQLARLMGMEWVPDFRPIEVVINGDYHGLYFLTETIRIDRNRVNIFKQDDLETDPDKICGGWLVEIDNYIETNQIRIAENDRWNLTVQYHSPEELSDEQHQWLTEEFTRMNAAIYSTNKYSTEWESHLDVESIARFFIIQEVIDNPDGFHGSFYLHKDAGVESKWTAGPVWDLSCYYRQKTDYTFLMRVHYAFTPHWIKELIQYHSFCQAVRNIWQEVYPKKLNEIYDYLDNTLPPLHQAWVSSSERWGFDTSTTIEMLNEELKTALACNMEWFDAHLPESPYSSAPEIDVETKKDCRIYNLQGKYCGEFKTMEEARLRLQHGIYITNGKKIRL
ncbi:MAG: CotH kinase family protein [Bacteroides sp.]|nr:CotH kinase family protein [Bacteroides sp.]MCM1378497.1 CotH kinase family protein [Bacteroides sp.]MCM1444798.1 CotH kinase family protein [Prevotella sp.]